MSMSSTEGPQFSSRFQQASNLPPLTYVESWFKKDKQLDTTQALFNDVKDQIATLDQLTPEALSALSKDIKELKTQIQDAKIQEKFSGQTAEFIKKNRSMIDSAARTIEAAISRIETQPNVTQRRANRADKIRKAQELLDPGRPAKKPNEPQLISTQENENIGAKANDEEARTTLNLQHPPERTSTPLFPRLQEPASIPIALDWQNPKPLTALFPEDLDIFARFTLPTGELIPIQTDDFFIPLHELGKPIIDHPLLFPASLFEEKQNTIELLCDGIPLTLVAQNLILLQRHLNAARHENQELEEFLLKKGSSDGYVGNVWDYLKTTPGKTLSERETIKSLEQREVLLSGSPPQAVSLLNSAGEPIQAAPPEITEHIQAAGYARFKTTKETEPHTCRLDIEIEMSGAAAFSLDVVADGLILRGYSEDSNMGRPVDRLALILWKDMGAEEYQDTIKNILLSAPLTLRKKLPADDDLTPVSASLKDGLFRLRIILPPTPT